MAATCNNTGQTAGWFIGNVVFLIFQSAEFSNKYIRPFFNLESQKYGIMPIHHFMQLFGVLFIIATTIILFYKRERNSNDLEDNLTIIETYKTIWKISKLPAARKLMLILFTFKIAFSLHSVSLLKLIEKGVSRESLGLLAGLATPFEILLPVIISKWTNGPNPLHFFIKAYPYRIIIACLIIPLWVYVTSSFRNSDLTFPLIFYFLCLFVSCLNSTVAMTMSITQVAFFTRISDKFIGGTYMTLLNTISNFGSSWPSTLALYLVDLFTIKNCIKSNNYSNFNVTLNQCATEFEKLVRFLILFYSLIYVNNYNFF